MFIQDHLMYILPDDNRTGIEICRSFYSFNLIQLCQYKIGHFLVNYLN